jgi:hypothetical protein
MCDVFHVRRVSLVPVAGVPTPARFVDQPCATDIPWLLRSSGERAGEEPPKEQPGGEPIHWSRDESRVERDETPQDDTPQEEPPNLDSPPILRRVLRGRLREDTGRVVDSMSGRLRTLRDRAVGGDQEAGTPEPPPPSQRPLPSASIVFTAGPRVGTIIRVQRGTIALAADGREMTDSGDAEVIVTVWTQGTRFMLRHSGGVLVGGSRPMLPVVTLEDGDDVVWGEHRFQFRFEQPMENP